jgi:hypothetical protein
MAMTRTVCMLVEDEARRVTRKWQNENRVDTALLRYKQGQKSKDRVMATKTLTGDGKEPERWEKLKIPK